jgi:hypothetical protein
MPKPRNSRRIRKQRVPKLEKLALSITTPEQARHGLREVDVANFSDADVKDADSLKRLKTVRKLTRIELLARSGLLTQEQALVCGWYAERHEAGFQTIGCTANYAGAGGGSIGSSDLLARYKDQAEARADYQYARQAIPQHLLSVFEDVVIGNARMPQGNDRLRFNLAVLRLYEQVGHMFGWAA